MAKYQIGDTINFHGGIHYIEQVYDTNSYQIRYASGLSVRVNNGNYESESFLVSSSNPPIAAVSIPIIDPITETFSDAGKVLWMPKIEPMPNTGIETTATTNTGIETTAATNPPIKNLSLIWIIFGIIIAIVLIIGKKAK